ncbi:hypothetical protein PVAP13_7NG266300 [Panicum virgatum]|uniref:Uncharacterized protein n=1 Tax=Panicum virgatum TaxID=38727 RepID=A0A8T0Q1J2_PANVG|nr:hypothetical protein PVAP13_7NG266300 [Panicum virgatum]
MYCSAEEPPRLLYFAPRASAARARTRARPRAVQPLYNRPRPGLPFRPSRLVASSKQGGARRPCPATVRRRRCFGEASQVRPSRPSALRPRGCAFPYGPI